MIQSIAFYSLGWNKPSYNSAFNNNIIVLIENYYFHYEGTLLTFL